MPLLAHSAHWLLDVAYVAPFVGLLIWLGVTTIRERRRAEREGPREPPEG